MLLQELQFGDGGMFIFYNTDNEKSLTLDEVKELLKENNIDYEILCGSNMKSCGGAARSTEGFPPRPKHNF